jgi:hypothetical protein
VKEKSAADKVEELLRSFLILFCCTDILLARALSEFKQHELLF